MDKQDIPLQKLDAGTIVFRPSIYKISDLYRDCPVVSVPHRLNFSALVYITEGEGEHYVEHRVYRAKAGSLITLGKNQIHAFTRKQNLDGYVLPFNCTNFTGREQGELGELMIAALTETDVVQDVGEEVDRLFHQVAREFESDSEFKEEIVCNLLRVIILKTVVPSYKQHAAKQAAAGRDDFFRMKKYIDEHYTQRPSATEIAAALGKSTKQLNKLALDNTGCSVKALVDERVLTEAKRLLAFSQFPVAEVAAQLGFNEATNLTKFFKRHTEISPKDFRQLCRVGRSLR